ncbi:MAG: VCBS repeat-containing protein [Planctomycetes bacterium]|nr:VCBS repeat-containing protein [Planctomycetota bacterium]MBL7044531.1 VCBS repeat-containing protein [Pirellulaceae bacterium]
MRGNSTTARHSRPVSLVVIWTAVLVATAECSTEAVPADWVRFRLTVTTPLVYRNVPMDPVIDSDAVIRQAGLQGVADLDSVEVINVATGDRLPHTRGGDFAYGDKGRIEWLIEDPSHRQFDIRFRVVAKRSPLEPSSYTPPIGTGDLLRYNAGAARPITLFYAAALVDLTGDERLDLAGCWNYAYRPGEPWDGIVCYPRVGQADKLHFGDLQRLRYSEGDDETRLQHFRHTYMSADFADFNRDGLVDIVYTRRGLGKAQFFLNSGKRDHGGMPIFAPSDTVAVPGWEACRAVDLDGDGVLDLVVDGQYIRNVNADGWPFRADQPVKLDAGRGCCFLDVDQDGRLDAVCLQGGATTQPDGYRIAWRRNLSGNPPAFAPEQPVDGIELDWCTLVAAVRDDDRSGLLVQHDVFQSVSFFEQVNGPSEPPRFAHGGRAESISAVLSLSDQAWPCVCDWDDDGDLDLLVGGGYGWPRIVINQGTRDRPAFAEARRILAAGKPIRLVRNRILGKPHNWHDMGYSYLSFVDWDGDGLCDLVFPNETNRIFWYQNVGTRKEPRFGERRQILCDGYPDGPEQRARSARLASDPKSNNGVYPLEKERPFMWRTGAAFADWTGDGLTDLVTLDGYSRRAALFAQYRNDQGELRLRRGPELKLADGRPIDDRIVSRKAHWTESFRAVDWDSDGLMDLIYSVAGSHSGTQDSGSIYLLRNCGTKAEPVFAAPQTMRCFGEPIRITNHGPHPWAGDLDGDGKPDLVCCVEWSVYPFYRHAALMMSERPKYAIDNVECVSE